MENIHSDPDERAEQRKMLITKLLNEYIEKENPPMEELVSIFSCSEQVIRNVIAGVGKSTYDYCFSNFLGIKYHQRLKTFYRVKAPYKTFKMKNCLKCSRKFLSKAINNRVCQSCRDSKAEVDFLWMSGGGD